jgi:DNA-binding response OmpR family regulator
MSATRTNVSRLLLCSSDEHKLAPLQQRLGAAGVAVDTAVQAGRARDLLWEQHYDGVVVDLLLADRDGISFAMELRQEHPFLSTLVISSTLQRTARDSGPTWLSRTTDYARLIFALKQASQRSAGRTPNILHVEDDDTLAELVQNTLGRQTRLFRARSAQEARIAMALRDYDLALVRTQLAALSDQWKADTTEAQPAVCVSVDVNADPFLTILNNLRRSAFVHPPAYC